MKNKAGHSRKVRGKSSHRPPRVRDRLAIEMQILQSMKKLTANVATLEKRLTLIEQEIKTLEDRYTGSSDIVQFKLPDKDSRK